MSTLFHKASICLNTYLVRGKNVLSLLESAQYDEAIYMLKLRKAAFHNFKNIENKLESLSRFHLFLKENQEKYRQIKRQDELLVKEIEKSKLELNFQSQNLKSIRKKLSQFRSKSPLSENVINKKA